MAIKNIKGVDENEIATNLQQQISPILGQQANWATQMLQGYFNQYPSNLAYWQNMQNTAANQWQQDQDNAQTPQQIAPSIFNPPSTPNKYQDMKSYYQNYQKALAGAKTKDDLKQIQAQYKNLNMDMSGMSANEQADIKGMQASINKAATDNALRVAKGIPPKVSAPEAKAPALKSPAASTPKTAMGAMLQSASNIKNVKVPTQPAAQAQPSAPTMQPFAPQAGNYPAYSRPTFGTANTLGSAGMIKPSAGATSYDAGKDIQGQLMNAGKTSGMDFTARNTQDPAYRSGTTRSDGWKPGAMSDETFAQNMGMTREQAAAKQRDMIASANLGPVNDQWKSAIDQAMAAAASKQQAPPPPYGTTRGGANFRAPAFDTGATSTGGYNALPPTNTAANQTGDQTTYNGAYMSDNYPKPQPYTPTFNPSTGEYTIGPAQAGTQAMGSTQNATANVAQQGYKPNADGTYTSADGSMIFNPSNNMYSANPNYASANAPNPQAGQPGAAGGTGGTATGGTGTTVTGGTTGDNTVGGVTDQTDGVPQSALPGLAPLAPVTPFDYAGQIQIVAPKEQQELLDVHKQMLKTNPAADQISNSMAQAQAALSGVRNFTDEALRTGNRTDAENQVSSYLRSQMNLGEDAKTNELTGQLQNLAQQTEDEKYLMNILKQRANMGTNADYRNSLYEASADPLRREAARMQQEQAADLAARGLGASTIVNDINSATQRELMGNLGDLSHKATVTAEELKENAVKDALSQMQFSNLNFGTRARGALSDAGTLRENMLKRISETGISAADKQRLAEEGISKRQLDAIDTAGKLSGDYAKTQASGAQLMAGLATAKQGLNQQVMDNIQDIVDKNQATQLANINLGTSQWDKRRQDMWNLVGLPQSIYSGQNPLMQATANLTGDKYQAELAAAAAKNQAKANLFGTIAGGLLSGFKW